MYCDSRAGSPFNSGSIFRATRRMSNGVTGSALAGAALSAACAATVPRANAKIEHARNRIESIQSEKIKVNVKFSSSDIKATLRYRRKFNQEWLRRHKNHRKSWNTTSTQRIKR